MKFSEFVSQNKKPLMLTLLIISTISFVYFYLGLPSPSMMGNIDTEIYENARYKVTYAPDGSIKVFALAKYNDLSKYMAEKGKPLPEENSMVIGFSEAEMMVKEGLIDGPGNFLNDFFGINTTVGGILKKTGQPIDMFHFLSPKQFEQLRGSEGQFFSLISTKNEPKFFFITNGSLPLRIGYAEGEEKMLFAFMDENGKKVCPIVLGFNEANMMRSEGLFSNVGDRIEDFFGNAVKIVGILEKTNGMADMLHFVGSDCTFISKKEKEGD